ncbi:MAG: septum formation initiator family protein [Pseudomonadota bacterium]
MKRDLQFFIVALCCIGLVLSFVHHTRFGRYGLEAQASLRKRLDLVTLRTNRLESVRTTLQREIRLLETATPEPDLVEEIARTKLRYAYPGDRILVTSPR